MDEVAGRWGILSVEDFGGVVLNRYAEAIERYMEDGDLPRLRKVMAPVKVFYEEVHRFENAARSSYVPTPDEAGRRAMPWYYWRDGSVRGEGRKRGGRKV